jgi:hypothetical protein
MALTVKNIVLYAITPRSSELAHCFRGTYCLKLQVLGVREAGGKLA